MSCIINPDMDIPPNIDYGLSNNFNELYENTLEQITTQQVNVVNSINNLINSNLQNINNNVLENSEGTSFEEAFLNAVNNMEGVSNDSYTTVTESSNSFIDVQNASVISLGLNSLELEVVAEASNASLEYMLDNSLEMF